MYGSGLQPGHHRPASRTSSHGSSSARPSVDGNRPPPLHHPSPMNHHQPPFLQSSVSTPQQPSYPSFHQNEYPQNMGNAAYSGGMPFDSASMAAASMFGRSAFAASQQYLQQESVQKYIPSITGIRYYWDVTTVYVLRKIPLILFPFRHASFLRIRAFPTPTEQQDPLAMAMSGWKSARDDINAPDMYIPTMALITYTLLVGALAGAENQFHPELLGMTLSSALGIVAFEVALAKFFAYLLGIASSSTPANVQPDHIPLGLPWLDLVSYAGYKFIGLIVLLLFKSIHPPAYLFWSLFVYIYAACGFFLVRSLRAAVLPESSTLMSTAGQVGRRTRVNFLLGLAAFQFLAAWLLL